jgi:hypothetical protein
LETAPCGAERARALAAAAFLWLRQDNAAVAKPIVDKELALARQLATGHSSRQPYWMRARSVDLKEMRRAPRPRSRRGWPWPVR